MTHIDAQTDLCLCSGKYGKSRFKHNDVPFKNAF